MKKISGLKKQWFFSTVGVIAALGLVCVLGVTACFAVLFYGGLEEDLSERAEATTGFFGEFLEDDDAAYAASCIRHVQNFHTHRSVTVQYLDPSGRILASSRDGETEKTATQNDIEEAISTRGVSIDVGQDSLTGRRVMAVSSPVIFSTGEVGGVLRYVAETARLDRKILAVAGACILILLAVLAVVYCTSMSYMRSIMATVSEITEKANRIASGSYGIQIQTKYDDEIGDLAGTINELSAKISQNEKIQAEFISQLSHELRTPLTVINGWSETLLSDESMDSQTRQGMKIISDEAKRLTEMVVELLDFTRMQDGRMTLNVEPCDLRTQFEETVYMYSARLAKENITLAYLDNDDEIPEITCDPKRLRQVFLNILDNAAKHGGEGKRIEASIGWENSQVVIRIRDFGPGIPEDEIPLVKKKFFKGSSKARGTGIGLAVCDEIVEMHGGELTLENAPGGGTLVTIRLPDAL